MDIDPLLATARETLLAPYDLEARRLEAVFGALAAPRMDYADLYFQYTRAEGWSLEEGIVKAGSFAIEQGVGVRAIAGERTAFAYSDEISLAALEDAARATRAIARQGGGRAARIAKRNAAPRRYEPLDPLASLDSGAKVRCWGAWSACAARATRASRRSWRASAGSTRWCWWCAPTACSRPTCGPWCACRCR